MTSPGDTDGLVLAQRYRLDERVGAGSMGAVWRATDELLGRTVAVKQLLVQPGAPGFDSRGPAFEEARQRILREGRLAARLQHPHAIAVFDVVLHDDVPWLVMEYLPSRTLGAMLDTEGPLEPLQVAAIGRQIADGLAAAHAAGIVHRDVKPGNVLIGPDGMVKITDFGVSRAADDVQLTRTGLIAGTPAYLAPEVARGQTPTPASDVFALGSTLYAAVEGAPPFGLDDNAYALLHAVGAGDLRPPGQAGPLTAALMRMLGKDPEQRPTATAARDELSAVAAGRTPAERSEHERTVPSGAPGRTGTRVDLRAAAGPATMAAPPPPPPPPAPPPQSALKSSAPPRSAPPSSAPPSSAWPPSGSPPARRPPAGQPPTAARPTRSRGGLRLAVGLAVLALLVVAAVAIALPRFTGQSIPEAAPAPPPVSASAVPAPPTRSSAPSSPSATDREFTAEDREDLIRDYYALLPGDPDAGWALLGEPARGKSNGFDGFRRFYAQIDRVSFADEPVADDGDTVRATLRFEQKDGGTSTERYEFTVGPGPDGQLIIRDFSGP